MDFPLEHVVLVNLLYKFEDRTVQKFFCTEPSRAKIGIRNYLGNTAKQTISPINCTAGTSY